MKRTRTAITDPDLTGALPALKRAAAAAWRLAVETGTPFFVIEDGRVVDRNAGRKRRSAGKRPGKALRARAARP